MNGVILMLQCSYTDIASETIGMVTDVTRQVLVCVCVCVCVVDVVNGGSYRGSCGIDFSY